MAARWVEQWDRLKAALKVDGLVGTKVETMVAQMVEH